jgi:hypothetical protein
VFYTSILDGLNREAALENARRAFTMAASKGGLPLSADSIESRSIERGLNILDAYFNEKWKRNDLNWKGIRGADGQPYIEIGFSLYFMEWNGVPVVCVGKIDRIMESRLDAHAYGWEVKTTKSGVNRYVEQVRPNHQLTCYKWAMRELIQMDIAGMILDVTHISDRKIGGKFENGVDVENDFARVETRRSDTDVDEFLFDLKLKTTDYLSRRDSNLKRWNRNAPAACFMYGGCHFRDVCNSNLNSAILRNKYKVQPWHPFDREPKVRLKSKHVSI